MGGKATTTTQKPEASTSARASNALSPASNTAQHDQARNGVAPTHHNATLSPHLGYNFSEISIHPPVQAKLTVGAPNDKYEQEADRIADRVMSAPQNVAPTVKSGPALQRQNDSEEEVESDNDIVQSKPIAEQITPLVQRQPIQNEATEVEAEEEEKEEPESSVQTKMLIQRQTEEDNEEEEEEPETETVQTKLLIQRQVDEAAEDEELDEEESESTAQAKPLIQRQVDEATEDEELDEEESESTAQTKSQIQRQADEETEDEEKEEQATRLQARSKRTSTHKVSDNLEAQINNADRGGQPLDNSARNFFEPRFGHDFSQVRIHSDSQAAQASRQLNAQAFTVSNNIFFGAGRYQPESEGGRKLLAHELTHTIQQTGTRPLPNNRSVMAPSIASNANINTKEATSPPTISRLHKATVSRQAASAPAPLGEIGPELQEDPEELMEWAIGKLQGDPEDRSGEVSQRLSGLTPELRAAVMAQVQSRLPSVPVSTAPAPAKAATPIAAPETEQASASAVAPTTTSPVATMEKAGTIEMPGAPVAEANAVPAEVAAEAVAAEKEGAESKMPPVTEKGPVSEVPTEPEATPVEAPEEKVATALPEEEVIAVLPTAKAGPEAAPEAAAKGEDTATAAAQAPAEVPDVSQSDPSQALDTIGNLPPAQLLKGLHGVTAAVGNTAAKQRSELAENPPQMERPSGAPTTKEARAETASPEKASGKVEKAAEGQDVPVPSLGALPESPASPINASKTPTIRSDEQGKVSAADAQKVQSSIGRLPIRDPALAAQSGDAPPLKLEGNADPRQVREQSKKFNESIAKAQTEGRQDATKPLGEGSIFPEVPQETLRATVPKGSGKQEGGGKSGGAGGPPKGTPAAAAKGESEEAKREQALSVIAQEEKGSEIQASVSKAKEGLTTQRQQQAERFQQEKQHSREEVDGLIEENSAEQTAARGKTQEEVKQLRGEWNEGQQNLTSDANSKAAKELTTANDGIKQKRDQSQKDAAQHINKGNQEATKAKRNAEKEAAQARKEGKKESGGLWGWIASKAKAFFDGIKSAIKKAFDAARKLVRAAIETAKKLAVAVIEKARKAVVGLIRMVGNALIAIGDKLLAGFPALRKRFRNAIKDKIAKAEAVVNKLADKLKEKALKALDALGAGLDKALGLMEKGMLAAVDVANAVVQGAIKVAKAIADAVGKFLALVVDVAADPIGWLKNLGSSIVAGIRDHLWTAFKAAIKEWFNSKLEQVLGLGTMIWNLLTKGGIKLAEIGKMAWKGLKAAIPVALVTILVEKLVQMLVPVAGAIMVIIEGLRAAWGTIKRILAAFQKFFAFLKAVRQGGVNAAKKFAEALAAAAIAVVDFVANWLLLKLAKAARGIASRVKKMAKKIGKKLKRGFKKIKARFKKRRKGKDKGKRKGKKLKPKVVLRKITTALRKPTKSKDPAAAIMETKALAASLRSKYQPRLKKGNIKIDLLDTSPSGVEKDGDIDINVSVNPKKKVARKVKPQLVKKMTTKTLRFLPHTDKSNLWQTEYARQLADQKAAINAMKVGKWQSKRKKFIKSGRASSSANEQKKFRQQFETKMLAKEIRKELKVLASRGVPKNKALIDADRIARRRVEKFMEDNVALHDPDQIAGGSPNAIKRMGLKRVNSSIGSQWRTRVRALDAHVKRFLKNKGDPKANMNVKLSRK